MSDASKFSVQNIARLARIEIADNDAENFEHELASILQFVEKINELELTEIEPFYGSGDQAAIPLRDDIVDSSLDRQDALRNAPQSDGEFFLVPPVFDNTD